MIAWRTGFFVIASALIMCLFVVFNAYYKLSHDEHELLECISHERESARLRGYPGEWRNVTGSDGRGELCERDQKGRLLRCYGIFDVMDRETIRRIRPPIPLSKQVE
jgi:hypothetical protein